MFKRQTISLLPLSQAMLSLNPLSVNPTKWSNTLKQFVGKLPTNCLSVFDHFAGLALKGLTWTPFGLTNGVTITVSRELQMLLCRFG